MKLRFLVQNFLPFADYVRKDTRLSLLFCTASDESWA